MQRYAILLFLLFCSFKLSAESLSFEVTSIPIKVAPTASGAETAFLFENKTEQPIIVSQLSTPCICLETSLRDDKKTYLPGEKGELKVKINTGELTGTLDKKIVLSQKDHDGKVSNTVLTVKIEIPETIQLTPKTVKWIPGETPTPKKIKVSINQEDPISILKASCSDDNFKIELKMLQEGKEYELTITPKDTTNKTLGVLSFSTDSKIPRLSNLQAYAVIMMDGEKTKVQP